MKKFIFLWLLLISCHCFGQQAQNAINDFVEYANTSGNEVKTVYSRVVGYYPRLMYKLEFKSSPSPRFECEGTPEPYYYNKAIAVGRVLTNGVVITAKAKLLHDAAEAVDAKCKALDTYHKLEDYKQDNFRQAFELINEIQTAIADYNKKRKDLSAALLAEWNALPGNNSNNANIIVDRMMRKEVERERAFLDLMSYNVYAKVNSGWIVDQLQTSIAETQQSIAKFKSQQQSLQYPASTMYESFIEALGNILTVKQTGLDKYNFEAKQSDDHSNAVYESLVSYFNGVLVADQNSFVRFATPNGYYGLNSMSYVPRYEVKSAAAREANVIKPFEDTPRIPFKNVSQAIPVPPATMAQIKNYIDLINEIVRQFDNLQRKVGSLNEDAAYYASLTSYKGHGGITFGHKDFEIPLSMYQTAVSNTGAAAPAWRKSCNAQALVLINILKELDAICIAEEEDTDEKKYEQDDLKNLFAMLKRQADLFEIINERKEQLYNDLRSVYDSYAVTNATGSWAKSGKALQALVDEDKVQLFTIRKYMRGDTTLIPETEKIDRMLRENLANEFSNLKGIQQLGGANGNDPYTPYEAISRESKTFSENLKDYRRKTKTKGYYEGYHNYVYLFNIAANDYNKFCELARVPLMPQINQPEMFTWVPPKKKEAPVVVAEHTTAHDEPADILLTSPNADEEPSPDVSRRPRRKERQRPAAAEGRVIHDTIRVTDIIRIETRSRDTVYIEKHDTVYQQAAGGDKILSLDGYAMNNMVFLLDVSGSMSTGQKLPVLKKSMLLLLKILRPEDFVSIVVYSGKAKAVLPPTSAKEQEKIRKVIENLKSDGNTDGNAGIKLAYKAADGNYIRGGNNRIILATDGEFPVSDETNSLIKKFAAGDIYLTVFNFGKNATSAASLEMLAKIGKGRFENITRENLDLTLIREAKGKKL